VYSYKISSADAVGWQSFSTQRSGEEGFKLNCRFASLFSSNADDIVQRTDKDFSITNFAGFGSFDDCFDGALDGGVGQNNFEFDLWEKVDGVFASAIDFRVSLLTAEALNFGDRHALDSQARKRFFNVFELERLNNGLNLFHVLLFANANTNNQRVPVNRNLKKIGVTSSRAAKMIGDNRVLDESSP